MCANCVSAFEAHVAQAAVVLALVNAPAHRLLAGAGLVAPPNPVARDARTVAFLRALELDPVEVLGAVVVTAADVHARSNGRRSVAYGPWARWAFPIGSQSFLSAQ